MSAPGRDGNAVPVSRDSDHSGPRPIREDETGPLSGSGLEAPPSRTYLWVGVGLVIALVVTLVLFAQQLQRAEQAEARAGALEKQLVEAEFQILAQKAQMASVRVAVDDLASRIGVLQEVVSESQPTSP